MKTLKTLLLCKRAFHLSKSLLEIRKIQVGAGPLKFRWRDNESCLPFFQQYGLPESDLHAEKSIPDDFLHLKTAVEVLDECGIKINLQNLRRFSFIYGADLEYLKSSSVIRNTNLAKKFLKYLKPFDYQPQLRMPSFTSISVVYEPNAQYHRMKAELKCSEKEYPGNLDEDKIRTIAVEQRRVLRQFYSWYFNTDLFTIDKNMYTYSKVTGARSLRSILAMLKLLEERLELKRSFVLRNFYLLSYYPERFMDVIENVPRIGSLELKEVVKIVPRILSKSSEQIMEMESLLKEFKIAETSASHYRYKILALTPSTLRTRLHTMATGDMAPLLSHSRAAEIIYSFTKASYRLSLVRESGMKCLNVHYLVCDEKEFQSFLQDGVDRSDRTSMVQFLSSKLETDWKKISQLLKHPYRQFVPLSEVKDTTEALLNLGFSKDIILESAQLLLYPRDVVLKTLQEIPEKPELKELHFESGFAPDNTVSFPTGTKFPDKRLVLCLYYLEKPYHFTGEGITGYRKCN